MRPDRTVSRPRLLVLGTGGQLGTELLRLSDNISPRVRGLSRSQLDVTDREATQRAVRAAGADVVVNVAAYTAVDHAEDESEEAFAVNRDGAANVAVSCESANVPLVHISTDYVFDGRSGRPYREDDEPNPVNVYGESKLAGERAVADRCPRHVILRSSWLFSAHGQNFVTTILRLAGERQTLSVVHDQKGCPTAAADLARVIAELARLICGEGRDLAGDQTVWGLFHFRDDPPVTWRQFAEAIVQEAEERVKLATLEIVPISTEEFGARAARPAYSVLDCGKLWAQFRIAPRPWRQGLRTVLDELCGRSPADAPGSANSSNS